MNTASPTVASHVCAAVATLEEGFVLFDRDWNLLLANPRCAGVFAPHDHLLEPGTALRDVVAKAVEIGHFRIVRGADGGSDLLAPLHRFRPLTFEVALPDRSRKTIKLTPLETGGIAGSITDVTDQRTAEARARDVLDDAIEAVDFGVALIDDDERIIFANRKFRATAAPDTHVMAPGVAIREIYGQAITSGILSPPQGATAARMLDEFDGWIRGAGKGFAIPNTLGREIVGNVYETSLGGRLLTLEDVTDQRRAERLFTDAVARLPVGVAIEGPQWQFSHCNDAFAAPFGLTADQMLKLTDEERFNVLAPQIASISGKDVGERGSAVFAAAVRQQRETLEPMEVKFHNGRHYLVERALTEDQGRVVVVTDTTALKEAENRSLQTLNDTIQSLDEGLAMFDRDGQFVLGNRLWNQLFFRDTHRPARGETLGAILYRLVDARVILPPEGTTADRYAYDLAQFVGAFGKKRTCRLGDGKHLLLSAHRTEAGGYLISFTDVTEQRRAEEEQRDADLLLRKIVEACPANFLVSRFDDGKVIYCPPPSRERFGDIDTTLSFFLNPEDRQHYLDALQETGSLDDYRVQFRRGDGSIMQGLTAARVTDYKGERVIVSSTRDISDLLMMQEELQRQRDMAHQAEKLSALGELLAGVAHELNNPLSIVVGYAQMLEGKLDDPVLAKRVDRIAEAANRSAKIVRAFLAMARQRPKTVETCSINDIAATALDLAGYGLRAGGAGIVTEFDDTIPDVQVDPDQLVQVFSNLIVNAEHALAPLGDAASLLIRSYYDAARNQSVVEVRDNGPGIPEDIRARIFDPFFTTKDVGCGTGIGLAFSHRIVDAHGGALEVDSDVGRRTSFFVRLEAVDSVAEPAGPQEAEPAVPEGKRVLVVDDEETLGELICDMLKDLHCRPVLALNARDALGFMETDTFDIVLSDFKMADMNGESFYKAVIGARPDYAGRVGFITGDTMGDEVFRFLSETRRPYIEKPILQDDLVDLLDRLSEQGAAQ
ncbi:PAS-domain containing protein [Chachezhania antarctica]|uniref:PAS-domain containing protein n=1 Tax=Chachezhania antarctica TaxID=2340860 RepID=UPI000EABCD39|nr:PAS-domain containing protein [Chachezhania antarctica]